MEVVGRSDIDDVDVGVVGQGLVARMPVRHAERVPEPVGGGLRARADGDQLGIGNGGQTLGELPGDGPRADDPPADFGAHISLTS